MTTTIKLTPTVAEWSRRNIRFAALTGRSTLQPVSGKQMRSLCCNLKIGSFWGMSDRRYSVLLDSVEKKTFSKGNLLVLALKWTIYAEERSRLPSHYLKIIIWIWYRSLHVAHTNSAIVRCTDADRYFEFLIPCLQLKNSWALLSTSVTYSVCWCSGLIRLMQTHIFVRSERSRLKKLYECESDSVQSIENKSLETFSKDLVRLDYYRAVDRSQDLRIFSLARTQQTVISNSSRSSHCVFATT